MGAGAPAKTSAVADGKSDTFSVSCKPCEPYSENYLGISQGRKEIKTMAQIREICTKTHLRIGGFLYDKWKTKIPIL